MCNLHIKWLQTRSSVTKTSDIELRLKVNKKKLSPSGRKYENSLLVLNCTKPHSAQTWRSNIQVKQQQQNTFFLCVKGGIYTSGDKNAKLSAVAAVSLLMLINKFRDAFIKQFKVQQLIFSWNFHQGHTPEESLREGLFTGGSTAVLFWIRTQWEIKFRQMLHFNVKVETNHDLLRFKTNNMQHLCSGP